MAGETEQLTPPGLLLTFTEGPRAFWDLLTLPSHSWLLGRAPEGDGHPVMVLPGFLTDDASTWILRRYLKSWGYEAYGWGLGRNLGPMRKGFQEDLAIRFDEIAQRHGESVSLVGQSLGGVYARSLAKLAPDYVRQVITLGSPFAGEAGAASVTVAVYEYLNDGRPSRSDHDIFHQMHAPLPVPATSIYSKLDGIVSWPNSIQVVSDQSENVEVCCSHVGMGFSAPVLYVVADRLAQKADEWAPFDRAGLKSMVYPQPVSAAA
jgi:pimeloyl-ACP methyl ester carboxylesterase